MNTAAAIEAEFQFMGQLPPPVCPEDPRKLSGAPLGMYHCPDCLCMVVAGLPHGSHELYCRLGLWDGMT